MKRTSKTTIILLLGVIALTLSVRKSSATEKQPIDSLLEQFEKKNSAETANRFMDALLKENFIEHPIRFTSRTHPDSIRLQVYYQAGDWLYNQQRYEEAKRLALMALPLCQPDNDDRANCLNLLGIIYMRLSDFSNAANYAKQCLAIDFKSGDDDLISSSLNTVAGIYMAANQPKEAEKYILRALKHAERVNNQPRQAVIFGMASEIYHKLGDDAKALPYAEQAYKIDSTLRREPQATIRLSQKGYALLGLQRYKEAESVFSKVIPSLKSIGDKHSCAIALNNMGTSLLKQGRPREAIQYYKEAAQILSGMGDLYNEIHSHRGLYESYWEISPDSARIELERFNLLKDSLYSHSTAEALSRYNAEFGNDLLQKENRDMRRVHRRFLIIGVSLLLFILLVSLLIIRYIRRRNQRRMLKLLAEIESLRAGAEEKPADELPITETEQHAESRPEAIEESAAEQENKLFLKRVIDAVNAAMDNGHLSVEQIAYDLNMGEQSLRRKLQAAAGENPKAFFTAIRMQRASSLLTENPEIPVSTVGEMCGFDNPSSFGHAFRRTYDCSPSQYREKFLLSASAPVKKPNSDITSN